MVQFFAEMSVLEVILFILASVSSIILVIQIILLIIGLEADSSMDTDGGDSLDANGDGAGAIFTVKGVISFFAIGGWVGFAISDAGAHVGWVITGALLSGSAALVGVGYLFKLLMKLQTSGNLKYEGAVGMTASVYLTIPAKGNGNGKINFTLQERFIEADAMTLSDTPIRTGQTVKITDYKNNLFIVELI